MNKEFEYDKKLDDVCSKYAQDLEDQIEEHYPKGFFIDEDIKGEFEGVLSEMYREIKPLEEKKEEDEYFTNSFGIRMKRQK